MNLKFFSEKNAKFLFYLEFVFKIWEAIFLRRTTLTNDFVSNPIVLSAQTTQPVMAVVPNSAMPTVLSPYTSIAV